MYARAATAHADIDKIHEIHDRVAVFKKEIAALVGGIDAATYYLPRSNKIIADAMNLALSDLLDDWTEDDLGAIAAEAQDFITRRGAA